MGRHGSSSTSGKKEAGLEPTIKRRGARMRTKARCPIKSSEGALKGIPVDRSQPVHGGYHLRTFEVKDEGNVKLSVLLERKEGPGNLWVRKG